MAWTLVQSTKMMTCNILLQTPRMIMRVRKSFSCLPEAVYADFDLDDQLVEFDFHSTFVPIRCFRAAARKVLERAQWEAKFLDHKFVGTEFILLGLIGHGKEGTDICIAEEVFKSMGIHIGQARHQVESIIGRGSGYVPFHEFLRTGPVTREIPFTPRAQTVFVRALKDSQTIGSHNQKCIGSQHLLLALLREDRCVVSRVLRALGAYPNNIRTKVIRMADERAQVRRECCGTKTPNLDEYGTNFLTLDNDYLRRLETSFDPVLENKHPVVGMQPQIKRVINILRRFAKNNPCLVGEHGVGKTSVAQGVANEFNNKEVICLDMGLLVRGDFQERLKKIIEESNRMFNNEIVLFIDDIHMLSVTGAPEGTIGAINLLKQALARGELQCIGATTPDKYRKYMVNDPSLERLFQPVNVLEPTVDETINILMGIREWYEGHHDLDYTHEALVAASQLSHKCISDRFLPGKAIDLIDEAASYVREKNSVDFLAYDDLLAELNSVKERRPIELVEEELDRVKELRSIPTKDEEIITDVDLAGQDLAKAGMLRDLKIEHKVRIWTLEERIEEMKKGRGTICTVTKADIQDTISSWDFHN